MRRSGEIESRHMRQDDRMRLGVRQPEAAQHVRELVLEPGAGGERHSGEPGCDQALAARLAVVAVGDDAREIGAEAARGIGRERLEIGRAVLHPQGLDAMRHRVHGARRAHGRRQRQCQVGIVDDRARQHFRIATGELELAVAHAPDGGGLRARIGGRDRDDREREIARDDLGEADGGAPAGGHEPVGVGRARGGEPRLRHRLGHMHHRLRMQARRPRAQDLHQALAEPRAAARRCDHQHAREAQPRGFLGDTHDRARSEHDALRGDIVDEGSWHSDALRAPCRSCDRANRARRPAAQWRTAPSPTSA